MNGAMPMRAEVAIRLNGHEVATIDAGTVNLGINVTSSPDGVNVAIDPDGALTEALRDAVENALAGLVADKEPEPEPSGWACPHGFSAARCALDCTPTEPEHSHTACPRGYSAVRCLVKCPHTRPADPACANHKPVQHRDGKAPWCNACGSFVAGRLSWHREPSSLPCAHVIPVDEGSPTACTKCGKTFHLTRAEGNAQQAPEQTRRQRARRRAARFANKAAASQDDYLRDDPHAIP